MTGFQVSVDHTRVPRVRVPTVSSVLSGLKRVVTWPSVGRLWTRRRLRGSQISTSPLAKSGLTSTTLSQRPSGLSCELKISRVKRSDPQRGPVGKGPEPHDAVAVAGGEQAPVGADARHVDRPAVARQAPDHPSRVRVDQRQEPVVAVAAHDDDVAAGNEADAARGAGVDDREGRARLQRVRVDDADRAVGLARRQQPAVGALDDPGAAAGAGGERPAEAASAAEIPDEHGAVDAGGVERLPVRA